jgi:two-component sensor histidine kinase
LLSHFDAECRARASPNQLSYAREAILRGPLESALSRLRWELSALQFRKFFGAHQRSRPGFRSAAEIAFGLLCGGCAILLGRVFDIWASEVSAFVLVYPLILTGTLYGRWSAGLVAGTVTFLWGWWHTIPPVGTLAFQTGTGPALVTIHAASALVTLGFAAAFRRAINVALDERDHEVDRGVMLIRELEHRTKNNFALVVGLLQAQKRQEHDPQITRALDLARGRIHSFARAYANLAESQGEGGAVAMKPYLAEVVSHFAAGGFSEKVTVRVGACDFALPRERAVGVGLFVNEALTNSAKHAFAGDQRGLVRVELAQDGLGGWELIVEDDGGGFDPAQVSGAGRGTGSRLMQAFAQQADASFTITSSSKGTQLRLVSQSPLGESRERPHPVSGIGRSRRRRPNPYFRRERGSDGGALARPKSRRVPPRTPASGG